jgi:hypothetical protein
MVAEEVARHTGRPTLLDADPKLVVALGAAGGAALMSSNDPAVVPSAPAGEAAGQPDHPAQTTPSGAPAPRPVVAPLAAPGAKPPAAKPARSDRGAAVIAGVAAAAGVAGAAYLGVDALTGDDDADADVDADADAEGGGLADLLADAAAGAPVDDPVELHAPEGSLDAFDDLGGGVSAGGVGGGARATRSGARGGGPASHHDRPAPRPGGPDDDGPQGRGAGPATPPGVSPSFEAARAELRDRLEAWHPPAGADPADVAELREELGGLLDRFQPAPGQSADVALAELRQRFDDQVEDFAQDVKIDALVEEQQRQDGPTPPPATTPPAGGLADVFDDMAPAAATDGAPTPTTAADPAPVSDPRLSMGPEMLNDPAPAADAAAPTGTTGGDPLGIPSPDAPAPAYDHPIEVVDADLDDDVLGMAEVETQVLDPGMDTDPMGDAAGTEPTGSTADAAVMDDDSATDTPAGDDLGDLDDLHDLDVVSPATDSDDVWADPVDLSVDETDSHRPDVEPDDAMPALDNPDDDLL